MTPMRFGIDGPLGGMLAREAEGALRILQSGGGFGIRASVGDAAVLDQQTIHADGVEPVTDFGAFEVDGEDGIASARKDNDSRAGVVVFWREIRRQGRDGDVAERRMRGRPPT